MHLGVSMDPRANYVTQSYIYGEATRLGPLTSARIHQYQLAGFYGETAKRIAEHRERLDAKGVGKRTSKPSIRSQRASVIDRALKELDL